MSDVTLTQIVAALSVTYTDEGVLLWLENIHRDGVVPLAVIRQGRIDEVADRVRRIGDADPSDFTVVDRAAVSAGGDHTPGSTKGSET